MITAIDFVIRTLTELYLLLLLMRFWLPVFHGDFRNPAAQGVLRLTSPLVIPLRRIIPPFGRIDTSTVIAAFIIQCLLIALLLKLRGGAASTLMIAIQSVLELATLSLNMVFFVILIRVILSWVAPHNYNPVTAMLATIAEPVLKPFRKLVPPIAGLDISPIFAIVLLQAGVIILHSYKPLLI